MFQRVDQAGYHQPIDERILDDTDTLMVFGLDQNVITQVAGAVTALASVIVYIATEGKIDAAAVGEAAKKVEDARDALTDKSGGEAV